jgi:hypothetical protein
MFRLIKLKRKKKKDRQKRTAKEDRKKGGSIRLLYFTLGMSEET